MIASAWPARMALSVRVGLVLGKGRNALEKARPLRIVEHPGRERAWPCGQTAPHFASQSFACECFALIRRCKMSDVNCLNVRCHFTNPFSVPSESRRTAIRLPVER